jgi:hypothetical protein
MPVFDPFEADSVQDIARTEGFEVLLAAIVAQIDSAKKQLIEMSGNSPIEEIRFQAGRVSGLALAYDKLRNVKRKTTPWDSSETTRPLRRK